MKIAIVVPSNIFGNWIDNFAAIDKKVQVDVFILNKDLENRFDTFFLKLDQKLFKGAKSLIAPVKSLNFSYINSINDLKIESSTTSIFNFTGVKIKGHNIPQYDFFVNKSKSVINEVINSTILPNYKKVTLKVKKEKEEFATSVRFDPISASKNLDLVLASFLAIIKNNLQDISVQKQLEDVAGSKVGFLALTSYAFRFFRKIIDYKFYNDQWFIAYQFVDKNVITPFNFKKIKKIIPPKDRFWADPIVIFENEIYYVFIEELLYANNKGHISVFEIHRDGKVTKPIKIIENDYHMSYPFVFKYKNEYYMIPETSHNNSVDLYKATSFPYKWEFEKTIFDAIKATDTTVVFNNNKWWMFTSIKEFENGTYDNVLSVFYTDNPITGKWKKHMRNTVKNNVENSRQGGPCFKDENGNLFRVSQNGCNTYGYGFNVHQVDVLNDTLFKENTVYDYKAIEKNSIGVHTFNKVNEIQVYDVLKRIRK
ncbi:MAG: hypothetical protein COB73_08890 [Flavobacteriaceae bacterium]|nr:MAG: hypothetical protein COB73_08890 [Flavobacteriaceae bacterium]